MANYKIKSGLPARQGAPAQLTEEQKREQILHAAAQKYNSIIEGVIYSAVHGAGADLTPEMGESIYNTAKHIAKLYVEENLGVTFEKKEEAK